MDAVPEGTITVAPITDALGHLWAKFVALGEAFIGPIEGAAGMQNVLYGLAGIVEGVTGAFSFMLHALLVVDSMVNGVSNTFRILSIGIAAVIMAIPKLLATVMRDMGTIMRDIPGMDEIGMGLQQGANKLDSAMSGVVDFADSQVKAIQQNSADHKKFESAVAAFDNAFDSGKFSKSVREKIEQGTLGTGKGGKGGSKKLNTGGRVTNIHKLVIKQDLRDKDPDRIMGAFVKKLEDVAERPTQANTQLDMGI